MLDLLNFLRNIPQTHPCTTYCPLTLRHHNDCAVTGFDGIPDVPLYCVGWFEISFMNTKFKWYITLFLQFINNCFMSIFCISNVITHKCIIFLVSVVNISTFTFLEQNKQTQHYPKAQGYD